MRTDPLVPAVGLGLGPRLSAAGAASAAGLALKQSAAAGLGWLNPLLLPMMSLLLVPLLWACCGDGECDIDAEAGSETGGKNTEG